MVIKLKNLIRDNYILKYVSLIIMFITLSIGFEAGFNLKYNFKNPFSYDFIPQFYIFGVVYEHFTANMLNDYIYITLGCILVLVLFFIVYKFNNKVYCKLEKRIIEFLSNFSLEVMLGILLFLVYIRFNIWRNTLPFYDTELIYCNFSILLLIYFCYKSIKSNPNKLKESSLIFKLVIDLLYIHNKKSITRKLASFFVSYTIFNLLFIYIFFKPTMKYMYMGSVSAIVFSIFTIVSNAYIYHVISNKFKYIEYISNGIKNVENGDLSYKLDVNDFNEISQIANSVNNISNGFETALEEQVKSEKMKTELITNVSHDLKTPLTSIVNYVDILKNNDLDKDTMKDYINILDKKSHRLKTLIEDIFEASKLSSGDVKFNIEKIDIKELLIQSIVELDDKIKESQLDFNIKTPDGLVFTLIDGNKTWRVFENLINNIIKYSLPKTRVYIDMYIDNGYIYIILKNISNHKLNVKPSELLDRFRRGDVSRNTDGSGLGLSIAQDIVTLQNGVMDIDIDGDLFKVILKFKYIY